MKIVYPNLHSIKIAADASEARKELHAIADGKPPDVYISFIPAPINFNQKYFITIKTRGIYRATLMLTAFLFFTRFTYANVTGPGTAWQFCRKITLSAATPSADFQVKVILAAGQYGNMNTNGNDLRFYDINNNVCSYWIEIWNNTGTSTIWVKVATSGVTALYLYYGNAAAPAASNGSTTFDFFDDFTTSLGASWSTITSGGSVTQSGTNVTLSNTNGGTVSLSNTSPFTPSSTSFLIETKHREVGYNRNRMYATTGTFGGSPVAVGDYGYFSTLSTSQTSAQIFWGSFPGATSVNNNTDYLTQWQITDGSTYNWFTRLYSTGAAVTNGSRTTTYGSNIRFISISVTEVGTVLNPTSTVVDWVRVRPASASFTDITGTAGTQVANISATITAQTNVLCNGKSTGAATVTATGGGTPYTYSWNTAPVQTTQTATNLTAGIYTATVIENTIGISATATATITQPVAVVATATGSNINCFNANDGQITVTGSNGATSSYMFSIDNGMNYQGGGTFINLSPGSYKPRVKDSNGCESKSVQ